MTSSASTATASEIEDSTPHRSGRMPRPPVPDFPPHDGDPGGMEESRTPAEHPSGRRYRHTPSPGLTHVLPALDQQLGDVGQWSPCHVVRAGNERYGPDRGEEKIASIRERTLNVAFWRWGRHRRRQRRTHDTRHRGVGEEGSGASGVGVAKPISAPAATVPRAVVAIGGREPGPLSPRPTRTPSTARSLTVTAPNRRAMPAAPAPLSPRFGSPWHTRGSRAGRRRPWSRARSGAA